MKFILYSPNENNLTEKEFFADMEFCAELGADLLLFPDKLKTPYDELLRGVDIKGDGLTFKGVTRLLYNALFVDIMKISGISGSDNIYSSEKGKNILTEYFKLNYKKGRPLSHWTLRSVSFVC